MSVLMSYGTYVTNGEGKVDAVEPFLVTIGERPGDMGPRLVYADWLEERGDPRGAWLRWASETLPELARESLTHPEPGAFTALVAAVEDGFHGPSWPTNVTRLVAVAALRPWATGTAAGRSAGRSGP